ncbi:MAG: alpha-E domain-containing protein [Bacteroidales bacterium]|nr:alpha-E domain-containing protein [Candidatus Liminaster caballi]
MILSANTCNRLFWLGRYAERGYLFLHLMRKAYDEVLDVPVGETPVYSDFLKKLDVYIEGSLDTSYQIMDQLYNPETVTSLRSIIEYMMDNAIVLRTEIRTESFSYIEMCRDLIRVKSIQKDSNITNLQPITDALLAFWGSIQERVYGRARTFLMLGKMIEHIDMNIRFDYKHYRIEEAMGVLEKFIEDEPALVDKVIIAKLRAMVVDKEAYEKYDPEYKDKMLNYLNCLVVV